MKNSSKNILLISPFFFPEPISTGKFNSDIVIALRDHGHNVKVLCFHPFYPKWKIEKSEKKIINVTIIRGGKKVYFTNKTFLRRIILEVSFALFLLRKIRKHQKEIDIIIPVFPPSLAFYSVLPFLKKGIKKIGMVHDLQEIYSENKKGFLFKMVRNFIHKTENNVYQSCDKLIFLSKEMKETAQKMYHLKESKLAVQYPFVTINTNQNSCANDLENILPNDQKHIVYSGALGEKQNSKELYKVFDYCSEKVLQIQFHFFSQGDVFEELKVNNNNKKIKFHDLVAKENIEELYKRSFIQIIPQLPGTSKGSLPSKLPNLLASKCNILCITDFGSDLDKLFNKYQLNKAITSWDKDLILNIFEEFLLVENPDNFKHLEISESLFNIDSMINTILEE
jgi:colanic acid biosynthesis glycosyl transferase WcaI